MLLLLTLLLSHGLLLAALLVGLPVGLTRLKRPRVLLLLFLLEFALFLLDVLRITRGALLLTLQLVALLLDLLLLAALLLRILHLHLLLLLLLFPVRLEAELLMHLLGPLPVIEVRLFAFLEAFQLLNLLRINL